MSRLALLIATLLVSLTCAQLAWSQEAAPSESPSPAADASPAKEDGATDGERETAEKLKAASASIAGSAGKAAQAVASAQQALSKAQADEGQAKRALAGAVAAVTSATAELESAQATAKQAQEAADETQAAAEADGATDAQKELAAKAAEDLKVAQAAETAAQEALEAAEAKRDEAETKVDAATKAVGAAQQALDAAQTELDHARAKAEAAKAAREAMERVANTPRGPTMSLDELRLRLRPMTDEELVAEADAWLDVLRGIATSVSYAQIASNHAEGEQKTVLLEAVNKLRDDRTETIDRLDLVLTELTRKGGDPAPYERYKSAISGLDYNPKDINATYVAVKGWVLSPQGGIRWAINITLFFFTLLAFRIIGAVVGKVMTRALASARVKTSSLLKDFFVNVARKAIGFLGIVVALSMLEVDVTPFLAAMGGGALVIGLALQGTLGNFAAGVMILMYRPYDIGHFVEVAGVKGTVDAMSLVATTLKTPDNQMVVVPNGSIWGGIITNVTGTSQRRVDLVFGIGYEDDMAKAEEILAACVREHPKTLSDPAPTIKVSELADSSVNFICRPWVKTADYWDVYWDLTRTVKERFDAEGISIPFPQRDIHVHQVVSNGNGAAGNGQSSQPAEQAQPVGSIAAGEDGHDEADDEDS